MDELPYIRVINSLPIHEARARDRGNLVKWAKMYLLFFDPTTGRMTDGDLAPGGKETQTFLEFIEYLEAEARKPPTAKARTAA